MNQAYEWIFSGVGVALVGWIGTAAYRHFRPKPAPPAPTSSSTVGTVVVNMGNATNPIINTGTGSVEQSVSAARPADGEQPVSITRVVPITIGDVRKAVKNAPPLQQADVIRHYIGLNVQWQTTLLNATRDQKDQDRVRLLLKIPGDDGAVYCHVRLSEYRQLGILHAGAPITVSGRIRSIDTLFIELEDPELFFNEPAGDQRPS